MQYVKWSYEQIGRYQPKIILISSNIVKHQQWYDPKILINSQYTFGPCIVTNLSTFQIKKKLYYLRYIHKQLDNTIVRVTDVLYNIVLLLGSLWLINQKVSQIKSIDQKDPSKSNESKAQQIPLSSFLYQILRMMTLQFW